MAIIRGCGPQHCSVNRRVRLTGVQISDILLYSIGDITNYVQYVNIQVSIKQKRETLDNIHVTLDWFVIKKYIVHVSIFIISRQSNQKFLQMNYTRVIANFTKILNHKISYLKSFIFLNISPLVQNQSGSTTCTCTVVFNVSIVLNKQGWISFHNGLLIGNIK